MNGHPPCAPEGQLNDKTRARLDRQDSAHRIDSCSVQINQLGWRKDVLVWAWRALGTALRRSRTGSGSRHDFKAVQAEGV